MILAGFAGITLLMFLVMGWLISRSQSHDEHVAQHEFQEHIDDVATVVSVEVSNLEKLAKQIARHPDLPALMSRGDAREIQDWTVRTRELIPDIVGLAIFDHEGNLYGDGAAQHVGPKCREDVGKLVNGLPVPQLPFHDVNIDNRHFDIVVPLGGASSQGDFLMISFRISLVEHRIRQMMNPDNGYLLSNLEGQELIGAGLTHDSDHYLYHKTISRTDWMLEAGSNLSGFTEFSRESWGIFGAVGVGTLLLAALITLMLRRRVEYDMQILKKQMAMIHECRHEDTTSLALPYFVETQELNRFINQQSANIVKLTSELEKEARHDPLTALFNRRALDESESRWLSLAHRGFNIGVLLLDLDGFKQVNDGLGHELGDRVLIEFADRLRAITRLSDECFRYGGDEFVVVQVDVNGVQMQQWFEKLQAAVTVITGKIVHPENPELGLGVSAGCAWIGTEDESIKAVIQRADLALYRAKGAGRGCLMFEADNATQTNLPPVA